MTPQDLPAESARVFTSPATTESLFDRFAWFYAFCRERVFRDDTAQIASALWPGGGPAEGSHLLEIGCGPGFYATRLEHFN